MNHFLQKMTGCALILSCCFLMKAYGEPAWPASPDIQAEAGIVVDADSGAVLGEKNADTPYPPASITKLLTALVVLEHAKLDDTVTFSDRAVNNVESDGGNKLNVAVGDKLSVEDCLYSLLVQSCNQVANALAEHVAGSQEAFVKMMNDKAKELGCKNSHFDNPSGLNGDTQNVTARDMALIARAAFHDPEIVKISSALSHQVPPTINNPDGFTILAENKLILNASNPNSPFYFPQAMCGKTGYLKKAGNTLAICATQDGKRLISIILKGKPDQYYLDGKSLLEFGFANFDNYSIPADDNAQAADGTSEASGEAGGTTGGSFGASFGASASDTPIMVGKSAYQPSELSLLSGMVTLPKGASLTDTKHNLVTDFPEAHPKGSVAFIRYTYQGRDVGGAYLTAKKSQATAALSGKEAGDQNKDKEREGDGKKGAGGFVPALLGIPLVLIALLAGAVQIYRVEKKKKRERRYRMEQRRRRIKETGVSEAEFQRLLNQRLKSRSKRKKKRK